MIALLVTLCLAVAMVVPVGAVEFEESVCWRDDAARMINDWNDQYEYSVSDLIKISYQLNILNSVNFYQFSIENIDDSGNILYKKEYKDFGVTDYFSVSNDSTGSITVRVRENEKENTLVYDADGSIYLDGNKIVVIEPEIDIDTDTVKLSENNPSPKAGVMTTVTYCSSGNVPSGFYYTNRGYSGAVISLDTQLKNIAVSVISSIVGSSLGGKASFKQYLGFYGAALGATITYAYDLVSNSIAYLCQTYPNEQFLSLTAFEYAKSGNDTLYSEFFYKLQLFPGQYHTGTPVSAGIKKIRQAT